MQRAAWILLFLLAFCIDNGAVRAESDIVVDDREASFMKPPTELLPLPEEKKDENQPAGDAKAKVSAKAETPTKETAKEPAKEAVKPVPEAMAKPKEPEKKPELTVPEAKAAAKASSEALISPPPMEPAPKPASAPAPSPVVAKPVEAPVKPAAVVEPPKPTPVAVKSVEAPAKPSVVIDPPKPPPPSVEVNALPPKSEPVLKPAASVVVAPVATSVAQPVPSALQKTPSTAPVVVQAPVTPASAPSVPTSAAQSSAATMPVPVAPAPVVIAPVPEATLQTGTVTPAAVSPQPVVPAPAPPIAVVTPTQTPIVVEAPAQTPVQPVVAVSSAEPKVTPAPLADIDPETAGLLSPSNGGLGASLWKETSRAAVDRLMPSIALPTASSTLNDLARRMFLSTAAAPVPSASGEKPQRSLLGQRIEALMALGAVQEAWRLANLASPGLVDPVTLRLLAEAMLIGADGKEVCDKISSLIEAHGKTPESAAEWQKSLIICQLRAKDTKAVQLSLDLMREQNGADALFMTLVSKNVLAESKVLPRQLTPLRPTNLAVLRNTGLPLPSELYARPDASLILELLQSNAADEKARLGLAERAGARGLITSAQLADVYRSVKLSDDEIKNLNNSSESTVRSRAVAFQAALNEQSAIKKVELVQRFMDGVLPSVLTGAQGKLAASVLDSVPVSPDHAAAAVRISRFFAIAGRPDKTLAWVKLARDGAARSPETSAQLVKNWPLYVMLGIVADGEYAQGMKTWLAAATSEGKDGKETHDKREKAGKVLLLFNAAGYAVPEDAWQIVMEITPPSKQMTVSPLVLERLRLTSTAERKGETVLLSLLVAGGGLTNEPSLAALTEIVRALRQAGFTAEAQALAREVMVALDPS